MALTKVSTAMFDTAAQSSDLNIDANTLFVDVSTNRVGIGTTSPSVPLEVSGQLKAGGITYPTSDGSNGQALVTNGSGVASFATVAPTAGTGVTVSGTTVSIGQAVATSSNVTFNNLVVSGTLTVNGATNTNSATNTTIEDILIELGTGTSGSPANDAGLVLERGSSDNVFIGWDESADTFTVGTGSFTGASSGNLTITPATAVFGGLTVDTSTLVVDASNNRVGIGNASPDVSLDIGSFTDAVHVPAGTTAQRPGSPAAGYFRYNSTLQKFEGYTTAWGEIGGGGSNTFTTDVFTGNGVLVAFTLSQSVSDVNDLIVFIDGVYQVPTAAYTVSGTTLTMTAAPANTRKIVAYSVKHMVSGSNINQNSFTGNGSAVAFTLATAPVNENNTQVFLDGVYQHKATYATSGTTLTFDTAPASGVAIEVMVFTQTEINVPVDGTITTVKLAADAVTSAKIADDAVGSDQLASGLTLGGNTAATLSTAAQPNITSVGTLSALTVSGNLNATLTTAAQPNITSVGTLSALTVSGNLNATLTTAAQTNITSVGTLTGLSVSGAATFASTVDAVADVTVSNTSTNSAGVKFATASANRYIESTHDGIINIGTGATLGGGTKYVTIDGGNVGIGASSPNVNLEIMGSNSYDAKMRFAYGTGSANSYANWGYKANSDGNKIFLSIANGGSAIDVLSALAQGHIGINTDSPDVNSFGTSGHGILTVATQAANKTAMINIIGNGNDTANTRVSSLFFNDASATGAGATLAGVEAYRATNHATDPGANLLFNTNESGGSYTERMRIDSTGNVGIGTTNPTSKLHVYAATGDVGITIETAEDNGAREPFLNLKSYATNANPVINFGDHAGYMGAVEYENQDDSMSFATNGGKRVYITAAGQLIVGSNTTSHTDETKVMLTPTGGQINTYNMSATNEWWIMNNLASNSGYTTKIDFRTQNTSRGYIGITGSTVIYYSNSDYRLKENYKYDFDATSLVKAMKPLEFTWKNEPMVGKQIGFLAHELKEVTPYVVQGKKDEMRDDGEIRPQVVDQGKLVAVLTKALQEAITRIEALEAK